MYNWETRKGYYQMYKVVKYAGYVLSAAAVLVMMGVAGQMDMESQIPAVVDPVPISNYVARVAASIVVLLIGVNLVEKGKKGIEENCRHTI